LNLCNQECSSLKLNCIIDRRITKLKSEVQEISLKKNNESDESSGDTSLNETNLIDDDEYLAIHNVYILNKLKRISENAIKYNCKNSLINS